MTARVGAESMITMSNWLRTNFRNSVMRSDDRSSDGLGGIGPDGVRKRFSMSQRKMIFSASVPLGQEAHQPDLVDSAEDLVLAGLAQVAVDQQHLLAELRQHDREVGGGRGLAFGGHRRGDHDHLELARRREQQSACAGPCRPRPRRGADAGAAAARSRTSPSAARRRTRAALVTALAVLATVGAFSAVTVAVAVAVAAEQAALLDSFEMSGTTASTGSPRRRSISSVLFNVRSM